LGETSPKRPILCQVGRQTATESIDVAVGPSERKDREIDLLEGLH